MGSEAIVFGTPSAKHSGHGLQETTGHWSWFSVVGVRFSMGVFAAPSACEHRKPTTENQPRQENRAPTGMDRPWHAACRTVLDPKGGGIPGMGAETGQSAKDSPRRILGSVYVIQSAPASAAPTPFFWLPALTVKGHAA